MFLICDEPLTRLLLPATRVQRTGNPGGMNSPLKGWTNWVIEGPKSPKGGITCIFSWPPGAFQGLALQAIFKASTTFITAITCPNTMSGRLTTVCATRLLPLLLLFTLPSVVQAQFSYGSLLYSTSNETVTITGYQGIGNPGGNLIIPDTIEGLPVTTIGYAAIRHTSLASITIPASVTSIGDIALDWNLGLTSVYFEGNAPSIGADVFDFDPVTVYYLPGTLGWGSTFGGVPAVVNLASQFDYTTNNGTITITGYTGSGGAVTIPSEINNLPVTSIGEAAFNSCCSLTNVTIPNSVTSIGDAAFYFCSGLTNITLPSSVTNIGAQAFAGSALSGVTLPSSVTQIKHSAFGFCYNLTNIMVDGQNPFYSSVDGVLFDKHQTTLIQYPAGGARSYTIPNSVTSILDWAFYDCYCLNGVTIPNSVTNIGAFALAYCYGLTNMAIPYSVTSIGSGALAGCSSLRAITVDALNSSYSSLDGALFDKNQTTLIQCPGGTTSGYTIPNGVTYIGYEAFGGCSSLTSVTIPSSVTNIENAAFYQCTRLTGVYCQGNAPSVGAGVFEYDDTATVYYLPGTTGWGPAFGGRPTMSWGNPGILVPPLTQTAELGSLAGFWVEITNIAPVATYQWYFDDTNALGGATNSYVVLADVQAAQAGAYTVVVTNVYGAVTSAPAMLSVIPPVERRIVPALNLTAEVGSFLQLDYVNSLAPGAQWLSLTKVMIESTPQLYFDVSEPLPVQRFYRAWQTMPSAGLVLDMMLATEIPLTGAIGSSLQIDYINEFGPTNAWVTLDTVTLTNTTQLYFDVTMFRQPARLYRLVPVP